MLHGVAWREQAGRWAPPLRGYLSSCLSLGSQNRSVGLALPVGPRHLKLHRRLHAIV